MPKRHTAHRDEHQHEGIGADSLRREGTKKISFYQSETAMASLTSLSLKRDGVTLRNELKLLVGRMHEYFMV